MANGFGRVAEAICEQSGRLLGTWAAVVDCRGVVIACTDRGAFGLPLVLGERSHYLRVPIHLAGRAGEAIVAVPEDNRVIAPHLAQVLVELLVGQLVGAMQLPVHQLKDKFIHDLLCAPMGDPTAILREGQMLGMDLTRPRAVVLIDAAEYVLAAPSAEPTANAEGQSQRVKRVIGSIVSFFHLPSDTICAYIGNGEIAVLKASSSQDLAAWSALEASLQPPNASWADLVALKRAGRGLLERLRQDTGTPLSIGIGRYHPRLEGLARSYQDARAALSLGQRFQGPNRVYCLDGLGIAAFIGVGDECTKIDLARHLLSPLDSEPELLATLEGFFATNCCPSGAANRLSIHRNTVSYRLDKIASFTGLDPRRFDDAVQIRLALLLRSLHSEAALCKRPSVARRSQRNAGRMPDESAG